MKAKEKPDKWWLTLLVAALPALIAGVFGWQAKDKAEKTSNELAVSYQVLKEALEIVQHESDANRDALLRTNETLVKLLEAKSARNAEESMLLDKARQLNASIAAPLRRPLPTNVQELFKK